jgi:SAM-dependent methyltransferase
MVKLNVCYIAERDEELFELSYKSIKDVADKVIVIDGNEYRHSYNIGENITSLHFPYPHEDKGADGNQRSKYLEYLKQNHMGEWCLVLDCDEVVDKPTNIKPLCDMLDERKIDCVNVHMRHFVSDLSQEDSTVKQHFVLCRLFKVTENLTYPADEHPVLRGWSNLNQTDAFCIWHFGYARESFILLRKYLNHCKKSTSHSSDFLTWWYHAHLLGEFPTSKVKTEELPQIIKEHFKINDEYLYFKNRGVELKHAECVKQWHKHFNPVSVLDLGCGRGAYLRYWEMCVESYGVELSEYAIKNKICESKILQGNVKDFNYQGFRFFELITCLDVLEHLNESELQEALHNIYNLGGSNFLFSIPFEGDPNLYADSTHKIFKPKEWWLGQLRQTGFKIEETPKDFYFAHQLVVAKK